VSTRTTIAKPITADQLLKMHNIGRCELIYGELVMMSPAGFEHGELALRIGWLLANFVENHPLGVILAAETGYLLQSKPDLVRAPDVSFVRNARVPKKPWKRYFPGAPDLAVEVLSPQDTRREVAEKINSWLAHGTISVWVVDPAAMTISIHRTGCKPQLLTLGDELRNDPALPGFSLLVSKIFKRP
jgi:Uma2 family endonuclease